MQLVQETAMNCRLGELKSPVVLDPARTYRPLDANGVVRAAVLGWNIRFVLGAPESQDVHIAKTCGLIEMLDPRTEKVTTRND